MRNSIRRYVAYYRVSTAKQGRSGLGIEAQRAAVARYVHDGWQVIAEFTEVESGKRGDRPQLEQALGVARLHRCPLVVAKVDRLTRSVSFLSRLLEAGVDVRFADLPAIEGPTGRFMLQQMAAVGELEAGLISTRTKAALAAAKARGQVLGGNRGAVLSEEARAIGRAIQANRAVQRATDLRPLILDLKQQGILSLSGIARGLNARGIPTARSGQLWTATQVARVLQRHAVWGVKRPAARGDELSLLIDQSPRGRLPNQRLQKSRVNPQAPGRGSCALQSAAIITIF